MASDKTDEPGVLGNLPRSRPGHRSDKRHAGAASAPAETGAKPVKATAAKAPPAARAKARPKKATASRPALKRAPSSATPPRTPPEPSAKSDPLTDAVRLAGKVAEVGIKTAGQLLRRLPGR